MPRRRTVNPQPRILAAAREIVRTEWRWPLLREVAAAAGVGRRTVCSHFDCASLREAVLTDADRERLDKIRRDAAKLRALPDFMLAMMLHGVPGVPSVELDAERSVTATRDIVFTHPAGRWTFDRDGRLLEYVATGAPARRFERRDPPMLGQPVKLP